MIKYNTYIMAKNKPLYLYLGHIGIVQILILSKVATYEVKQKSHIVEIKENQLFFLYFVYTNAFLIACTFEYLSTDFL